MIAPDRYTNLYCLGCKHADKYHVVMRMCLIEGCNCKRFEFESMNEDDKK
mgnify:CR=1 FL=1